MTREGSGERSDQDPQEQPADGVRRRGIELALAVGVGLALVALVVGVVAVNRSGDEDVSSTRAAASPASPDTAPRTPDTAPAAHRGSPLAPADGTSPCEVAAPNGNDGGSTAGMGERGPMVEQPLDGPTEAKLDDQLAATRAAAVRYPTAADAKAAGYIRAAPYLPCIASHYTSSKLIDGTFDPSQPEQLLYDGNGDDAKLVGVSFLVASGATPPDGFAGPNDHWHQHIGLCMKGDLVIGPASMTDEQCTSRGGQKTVAGKMWMAHAWVVPGHASAWGTFSGENPALGALPKP